MASLTNSPKQTLNMKLERRKSYSFVCTLLDTNSATIDLTGCTLRMVMKDAEYDDDMYDQTNVLVNSEATISTPESGEGVFSFQAAELDQAPGDYPYTIVLWTADGFSATIVKGIIELQPNTDSLSMLKTYTSGTTSAAIEVTLRGSDTVNIVTSTISQSSQYSPIVGQGRPDQPATLDTNTQILVNAATFGKLFLSTDGPDDLWAWRLRNDGWHVVEEPAASAVVVAPVAADWNTIANKPVYVGAGDSMSVARAAIDAASTGLVSTGLAGKADTAHTHPMSSITGYTAPTWSTLTGRPLFVAEGGTAAAARTEIGAVSAAEVTTSVNAGIATRALATHTHVLADITDYTGGGTAATWTTIAGKPTFVAEGSTAAAARTSISAVDSGYVTSAIAGKSDTGHTHLLADITDYAAATAPTWSTLTGKPAYIGAGTTAAYARSAIGATDQSYVDWKAGVVQAQCAPNAHTHDLSEITGYTPPATPTAADVGLGNVNNTSDANKPVSTAQSTALAGKSNTGHTHAVGDLTATGTKDSTTFLRGDNTWAVPAGGGGGTDPWTYYVATTETSNGSTYATNAAGLTIPSGLTTGVYDIKFFVITRMTGGSGIHTYALTKPSGGDLSTVGWSARGSGEVNVAVNTSAGGDIVLSSSAHPNATWGAPSTFGWAVLTVASLTTEDIDLTFRPQTSGCTLILEAGSYTAIRKIS